jgi:hypothetical protein
MPGSVGKSVQRTMPPTGLPAALVALLAAALACTTAGCFLPILTAIPSVINLAHSIIKGNNPDDPDAVASSNPDAKDPPAEEASKPAPQLTPGNMCQMMAIARPDMVLVELRKNSAGAPEYRELHLQNSADEAHWAPVVGTDTAADGWLPAVNFLKMDFNPPLTSEIPDTGTSYLAYAPSPPDANDPTQVAQIKPPPGSEVGTFSWGGRIFQYTVARNPPCLAASSQQAAASQ